MKAFIVLTLLIVYVFSQECTITPSEIIGPFYVENSPLRTNICEGVEGEQITIKGRVLEENCITPIGNAKIEVWQADSHGNYSSGLQNDFACRGHFMTNENGTYEFTTVKPGQYTISGRGTKSWRPAHIHFRITTPDNREKISQLYFKGDPYLGRNDACAICISEDPSLQVDLKEENGKKVGEFIIVLQSKNG